MPTKITNNLLNELKEKAEKDTHGEWPPIVLDLIKHIERMNLELYQARCEESYRSTANIRANRELAWACNMLDHVCASFPSCDKCPLPKCKTDNPDFRQMASDAIDEEDMDIDAEVEAMNEQ